MNLLYFCSYRVAMIFLLAYISLFTRSKFGQLRTVLILAAAYIFTSITDVWGVFFSAGGRLYLVLTALTFACIVCVGQILSEKKGWRSVFTVLCGADFILPGNTICYIVYNHTKDIFSSILIQTMVQSVLLLVLVKTVAKEYKENEKETGGWAVLCLIPLLFFLATTWLSVWPMSLIDYPVAVPGVVLLFVLMVITFASAFKMYSRRGLKQKQDMSLVFLAEYSDRLKAESAKVNEMSCRIEEMSGAMLAVTSEILNLLDKGQYDDIRTLVSAIMSDSRLNMPERKCSNNAINSVVLEADEFAVKSGVKVNYNLNVPEHLGAIEFEYAVVVERLLHYAIRSCSQYYVKEMSVSMYLSGAWMNIEMRSRYTDGNPEELERIEETDASKKIIKNINDTIDFNLSVPEIEAFIKKYEVQKSVQFKMGMMISEFNVRIN
ncbi:hypothetical protein [Treponema sp.]|uniref:hypothetical protein n=1 Tax=Treponema sp. TaxID=166 RepID=UPI00388F7AF5